MIKLCSKLQMTNFWRLSIAGVCIESSGECLIDGSAYELRVVFDGNTVISLLVYNGLEHGFLGKQYVGSHQRAPQIEGLQQLFGAADFAFLAFGICKAQTVAVGTFYAQSLCLLGEAPAGRMV